MGRFGAEVDIRSGGVAYCRREGGKAEACEGDRAVDEGRTDDDGTDADGWDHGICVPFTHTRSRVE